MAVFGLLASQLCPLLLFLPLPVTVCSVSFYSVPSLSSLPAPHLLIIVQGVSKKNFGIVICIRSRFDLCAGNLLELLDCFWGFRAHKLKRSEIRITVPKFDKNHPVLRHPASYSTKDFGKSKPFWGRQRHEKNRGQDWRKGMWHENQTCFSENMRIVVIAARLPHCECTDVKLTDVGNLGEGSALKAFYCSDNPPVANTGLILVCRTAFCFLLKLKTLSRSIGKEVKGGGIFCPRGSQFQQKTHFSDFGPKSWPNPGLDWCATH